MNVRHNAKRLTMTRRQSLEGIFFISPWLIGFLMFFIMPFLQSVQLSFSKITKVTGFELEWVGPINYINAFVRDITFVPLLINAISDTLVNTPLTLVFSLFIAMLINRDIKFRGFFRGSFFLPVLLGTGFVLKQLLGMNVQQQAMDMARGVVMPQEALNYLGPAVSRFINGFMDQITIIFWMSGVQIILFLAGLQNIPVSLYEASKCDGATVWEMFWKITLPMMVPVIFLNAVYTLIDMFTSSTNQIVEYILALKSSVSNYEYAAALGMIYFIFVFAIIVIIYAVCKKSVYNTLER